MIYYSYSHQTGELVAQGIADESPLDIKEREGREAVRLFVARATWEKSGQSGEPPEELWREEPVFLIPAFSTVIAPPPYETGQIPVFDQESETWELVADHRTARVFSKHDGAEMPPLGLGETLSEGQTFVVPPDKVEEKVVQFDDATGTWKSTSDFRGRMAWDKQTQRRLVIDFIGDLPDSLTFDEPMQEHKWGSDGWAPDTSAIARRNIGETQKQLEELDIKSVRMLRELAIYNEQSKQHGEALIALDKLEDIAKQLRAAMVELRKVADNG